MAEWSASSDSAAASSGEPTLRPTSRSSRGLRASRMPTMSRMTPRMPVTSGSTLVTTVILLRWLLSRATRPFTLAGVAAR